MLYVCLHLPFICFRVAALLANKDEYIDYSKKKLQIHSPSTVMTVILSTLEHFRLRVSFQIQLMTFFARRCFQFIHFTVKMLSENITRT